MASVPELKLDIQRAAASLARANGGAFEQLMKALEAHVGFQCNAYLWAQGGNGDKEVLQGRAQEATALWDTLRKANAVVSDLEQKGKLK